MKNLAAKSENSSKEGGIVLFDSMAIQEVTQLRSTIKSQSLEVQELYQTISSMSKRLSELTPENEILRDWITQLVHFTSVEINEVIRLEKFFIGTLSKGVAFARRDFGRQVYFTDFVEAAKLVALEHISDKIAADQVNILKRITFNTMTINWGTVKGYSTENPLMVPKDLQDHFACYIFEATEEAEEKFLAQAKLAYAVSHTDVG